jgi:hypothetical protein
MNTAHRHGGLADNTLRIGAIDDLKEEAAVKTLLLLASLVMVSWGLLATSASAGIRPYARVAYGGNQLKMSEVNASITSDETALRTAGLQADLDRVGLASGLEASAGLWLFPSFRVGGTWATQKSVTRNRVHGPGFFYGDDLEFQMKEIGAEAMIRVARLGGLSLGGQVAQGRADFIEGFTVEDYSQQYYLDATADYTKTTYAAFIGFEQTNPPGPQARSGPDTTSATWAACPARAPSPMARPLRRPSETPSRWTTAASS